MKSTFLILIAALITLTGCSNLTDEENEKLDPHSYSNYQEVVTTHIELNLNVNFDAKQIQGKTSLTIDNKTHTDSIVLDTYELKIDQVTLGENETEADFYVGEKDSTLGSPLIVRIKPSTKLIHVYYKTSGGTTALQWLSPEQTKEGNHPFLFTQSQAINARSWLPCQDSPGIRFTYDAEVTVPKELLALMSAKNPMSKNETGVYNFKMPQPIPSYLLALTVGDLKFSELGPRTGVYAEPSVVAKAAKEFIDTEKMIKASEELYGPYLWGRYDIVVMPPSFPYGGMENPRLTFLSPTLLAGDKSLNNVVAHEIAHSWSGNLVTNATWNDFWINEGFTSYFEQRIMEKVYGFEYKEMLAHLDYQNTIHVLDKMGWNNPDTRLYVEMAGRNPLEKISAIAYDKGALFLRTLEEKVGREKFDKFLSNYFDEFKFKTMTSNNFVEYAKDKLVDGNSDAEKLLKIDEWVFQSGLPENHVKPHAEEFDLVDAAAQAWLNGIPAEELETNDWTTHHYLHFIRELPWTMSKSQLRELDDAFEFTSTQNSEILHAWLLRAIHNNYSPAYDELENFLLGMGRRKYLRPLYHKLVETEEGRKYAVELYEKARPLYHPISRHTVDQILGWGS